MYFARSARQTVAGILAVAGLAFASACSTGAVTGADDTVATTTTVTTAIPGTPDATGITSPANQGAQQTTESASVGDVGDVGDVDDVNFTRIDQSTYDIALGDTESAVFTSGDGSLYCSFTAEHGQYSFPQKIFAIDETVGACLHGMENADGSAGYVSVNTDPTVQPALAEPQEGITPTFPGAPATLDAGEFVHLGKLGCFAPTTSEITCTKFTTGEAFTVEGGGGGNGFTDISDAEVSKQLTDTAGRTQVLSRVIDLPLEGEAGVRCFSDTNSEGRYSCMSVGLSGWESTEGPGPANILTWQLDDGNADFVRAFAANPGFDVYESRQPLEPGQYLLDGGLVADYDGSQVTFTTLSGDSFWINGPDYGTQKGSG